MEIIDSNEAKKYEGGGLSVAGWAVIGGGLVSFFLGMFNGFTNNSITCRK